MTTLIAYPSNAKLKSCLCLHSNYSTPPRKPQLSITCYKPKPPTSKSNISRSFSSTKQRPILKVWGLENTHTHHTGKIRSSTRLSASTKDFNSKRITTTGLTADAIINWAKSACTGRLMHCGATNMTALVLAHGLALFAPFTAFNWGAFWVAMLLNVLTGMLGLCLSYHRNLSHRSFTLPKWLEYFCAYCGALALQGNPIDWVSTHRYHHRYCDTKQDPHSPLEGIWFSHFGWLYSSRTVMDRCGELSNVQDLENQPFYRFMRSTYILHPIALGVILYAFGGFPYIVWGMGVRILWGYHMTALVNSVCHLWGHRSWNTGDFSRNNWWVALLTHGEGWHNNHHAFEYSARHGLEWWEVDMTWYVIRLLQEFGLAKNVKLPIEAHKKQLALKKEAAAA